MEKNYLLIQSVKTKKEFDSMLTDDVLETLI